MVSKKKGEMGIGVLLLLIGIILIVTLIVSLFITTAISFETKSHDTAKKAKKQVTNRVTITDISSYYLNNGNLKNIEGIIQLDISSEGFHFEDFSIKIKTEKETASLTYAGTDISNSHTGYYTLGLENYTISSLPYDIEDDVNEDGLVDQIILDQGNIKLNLSSNDGLITLGNCSINGFVSKLDTNSFVEESSGTCNGGTLQTVSIALENAGRGKYSIEYIKKGDNYQLGRLFRGDMARIYFEMPRELKTEKEVTLTFIPKTGSQTILMFVTPDTPSIGRISLSHY